MRHNTIISKIFLTMLAFGMVLWLGGSIIRMSTAYDIYVPFSELVFKQDYSDAVRLHAVKLFAFGALYTGIGFSVAFFGYVLLGFYLRKELRRYGWLFMSLIFFLLAAPWGFYELYLDIKLNFAVLEKTIDFTNNAIKDYFMIRFSNLSIWALLSYMSAISSILVIVWRPLHKLVKPETEISHDNSGVDQ